MLTPNATYIVILEHRDHKQYGVAYAHDTTYAYVFFAYLDDDGQWRKASLIHSNLLNPHIPPRVLVIVGVLRPSRRLTLDVILRLHGEDSTLPLYRDDTSFEYVDELLGCCFQRFRRPRFDPEWVEILGDILDDAILAQQEKEQSGDPSPVFTWAPSVFLH